jgi:hypothetical protein
LELQLPRLAARELAAPLVLRQAAVVSPVLPQAMVLLQAAE